MSENLRIHGTNAVDDCVSKLESASLDHNSSNLISQLNYDILLQIFMLNTVVDLQNLHIPSRTTRWTSQVHHSWREIMLGYPLLWAASLDLADPPRWIDEVVMRAGSAPFADVILPSVTPTFLSAEYKQYVVKRDFARNGPISISEVLQELGAENDSERSTLLAAPLIQRCRRFFAKIKRDKFSQIAKHVSKPSSNIHTFSIVIKGPQRVDENLTLPSDMFWNLAPHLRILDLRGCGCYFDSPIFHNLTTLIVRKPSSFHVPTPQSWLRILSNMTMLHTLDLTGAIAYEEEDDTEVPVVTLPHLKSLALLGNLEPCSLLFTHLDFPITSTCVLDIRCYRTRSNDYFHSMVSHLQKIMQLMDNVVPQTGLVVSCKPTGLKFMRRCLEDDRIDDAILSFEWFSSYAGPNIMAIFPVFLDILETACSEVQQLRVDVIHSAALSYERLIDILQVFRNVKKLYMAMSDTVERLLPAMNRRDIETDWVPFPSLETIVVEHAFHLGNGDLNEVNGLIDFVRGRSQTQFSIEKVIFYRCGHHFTLILLKELGLLGVDVTFLGE